MASRKPVSIKQMQALFMEGTAPSKDMLETALKQLEESLEGDVICLKQVASGYAIQVRQEFAEWVGKLSEEKPPRYSRALLETLAIIAYRQPITRSEIESIRGVAVSTHMVKTLLEREWIRAIGHKDVPGKPAIYGTTPEFLDYFNLTSISELPPIGDIKDLSDDDLLRIEAMLEEGFGAEGEELPEGAQLELSIDGAERAVDVDAPEEEPFHTSEIFESDDEAVANNPSDNAIEEDITEEALVDVTEDL